MSWCQGHFNHETRFVMHDLITDLAQSVARQVCINLEDKLEHNKNYTILQDYNTTCVIQSLL